MTGATQMYLTYLKHLWVCGQTKKLSENHYQSAQLKKEQSSDRLGHMMRRNKYNIQYSM